MNSNSFSITTTVTEADKGGFAFEYEGTKLRFSYKKVDLPIYHGYIVTRLYKGEVIVFTNDSEDPMYEATVEIPAAQAFCAHVYQMQTLLKEALDLETARKLYSLLEGLNPLIREMVSARASLLGKRKKSIRDKTKHALGLTSSKLGTLNRFHFDNVRPQTAIRTAKSYLGDCMPKLSWVFVIEMVLEMINHILENRLDELVDDQELELRSLAQEIEARIEKIAENGFDQPNLPRPNKRTPYPQEILNVGESRIGRCIRWSGGTNGRVQWEEDDELITVKVKQYMIMFPKGRIPANRKLFIDERVRISIITRQQLADKYFDGNVEGGSPDEPMAEIVLLNVEDYLRANEKLQEFIAQDRLTPSQEEALAALIDTADMLHAAIMPERRKSLRFKNWHSGVQRSANYKLGITKPIRRTLDLTPDTSYEQIWGRVKFYRGKKGEHLDYGKRMELAHLRSLAQTKLDTQDLPLQLQQRLDEVIEMIDDWLEPFES
ncbi:hypothetical protein KC571_00375 [candidate division WWE3 bacterium]|uniref:Uncharacterized protein n=1 Tax=candidate division WWE3 bacterium TaxID=2053526 RepID=A0A955LGK4_UNCKA|nr:hypothetical protein [candidate division WWE3 bacterium]